MARTELISCHNCGNGISFSAVSCPHCGSTEPSGSYRLNAREARRARIEERNDRRLILMTVGFAIGVLYGLETVSSTLVAIVATPLYSLVGATISTVASSLKLAAAKSLRLARGFNRSPRRCSCRERDRAAAAPTPPRLLSALHPRQADVGRACAGLAAR